MKIKVEKSQSPIQSHEKPTRLSWSRGLKFGQRLVLRPEFWVGLTLGVAVFATSMALRHTAEIRYLRLHLGAENYNVARAIVDGRGYSDPFAEPTGPTAWVTPAYPLLLSALLLVFGDKGTVGTAIVLLTNLSTIFNGMVIYHIARKIGRRVSPLVAVIFYSLWVGAFFYWYFLITSDVWLFSLVVSVMMLVVVAYLGTGKMRSWLWGMLWGVASVTSSALALAWGCLLTYFVLREQRHRLRCLFVATAVAAVFLAPWTIRNLAVFGKLIPSKSNLGCELYQANIVDDDGIYSDAIFTSQPYDNANERFRYHALGEMGYVRKRQSDFLLFVQRHPMEYVRRVAFRAFGATLLYVPLENRKTTSVEVAELRIQRTLYPIPFVMFMLALPTRQRGRELRLLSAFYAVYLLPYILIAYYIRYILPLTPLLALSVYLGLEQLYSSCVGNKTASSHDALPKPG